MGRHERIEHRSADDPRLVRMVRVLGALLVALGAAMIVTGVVDVLRGSDAPGIPALFWMIPVGVPLVSAGGLCWNGQVAEWLIGDGSGEDTTLRGRIVSAVETMQPRHHGRPDVWKRGWPDPTMDGWPDLDPDAGQERARRCRQCDATLERGARSCVTCGREVG